MQLPGEDVDIKQRFAACVTLASKLQQLRVQEFEMAKVEQGSLAARCSQHEIYLDMLERAKRMQPAEVGSKRERVVSTMPQLNQALHFLMTAPPTGGWVKPRLPRSSGFKDSYVFI